MRIHSAREAAEDLLSGFMQWRIWLLLAFQDIRQRYRRTVLGPFWLSLSTAIWIGSLGLVFGTLFRVNLPEFFPYVAAGTIIWVMLSQIVTESCTVFLLAKHIIESMNMPFSVQIFRFVSKAMINFFHNIVIFVLVVLIFPVDYGLETLLVIPGLFLVLLNAIWLSLVLGIFGARYRDLQQIMQSLVQVTFFVTPIFWTRELLGNRPYLADLNPLFHFLEIVRAPLLGTAPSMLSYSVVIVITIVGWIASFVTFRQLRSRVYFWL